MYVRGSNMFIVSTGIFVNILFSTMVTSRKCDQLSENPSVVTAHDEISRIQASQEAPHLELATPRIEEESYIW